MPRLAVLAAIGVIVGAGLAALVRTGHGQPRTPATPTVERVVTQHPHRRIRRTNAPERNAAARNASAPILMYHVLASPPRNAPFPGLYVTPGDFAAQMHALARAGFHAVTLDQLRRAWLGRSGLPRHPVVISFDNGYRTQYTVALPILRRLGWVGDENLQLSGLPPRQGGLTDRQITALITAGWELDTQGYSHADLPALDPGSLARQIVLGRRLIERRFGVRPHWFCYPSGRYDAAVVAEVRAAGFVGATTVAPGWADRTDDRYRLPRLRVLAGTSPAQLLALVRGWRRAADPPASY